MREWTPKHPVPCDPRLMLLHTLDPEWEYPKLRIKGGTTLRRFANASNDRTRRAPYLFENSSTVMGAMSLVGLHYGEWNELTDLHWGAPQYTMEFDTVEQRRDYERKRMDRVHSDFVEVVAALEMLLLMATTK